MLFWIMLTEFFEAFEHLLFNSFSISPLSFIEPILTLDIIIFNALFE